LFTKYFTLELEIILGNPNIPDTDHHLPIKRLYYAIEALEVVWVGKFGPLTASK
jgi:hypothetical protein